MHYKIWNVDTARPIEKKLRHRQALRYAGLLEALFNGHYTVIRA